MLHTISKFIIAFCFLGFAFSASAQVKKVLYIADRTTICDKRDCIQFKEKKKDAWKAFTDSIKGFNYEEGNEYRITVSYSPDYKTYKLTKINSQKKTKYNTALKLEGRKWVLVNMFDSVSNLGMRDTTVFITLDVTYGRISGHGVCNQLKGSLKAQGKSLTVDGLGWTKKKCQDQGNIFETIITNLLSATDTYEYKDGVLTLYSTKKGSNMVFKWM
jgi:heat shock protein HslJ